MRGLLTLLLLLAGLVPALALAQDPVHRCMGADGHPVFTDQPCMALGATSLAPVAPAADEGEGVAAPPPAVLCAVDRPALQQAIVDAFAHRDANRLAGLMLWGGYGRGAAVADIRALQNIMREPLLGFDPPQESASGRRATDDTYTREFYPFDATTPTAPLPVTPAPDTTLVLHTAAGDGLGPSRSLRFRVVRRSGCLWLRSAD